MVVLPKPLCYELSQFYGLCYQVLLLPTWGVVTPMAGSTVGVSDRDLDLEDIVVRKHRLLNYL